MRGFITKQNLGHHTGSTLFSRSSSPGVGPADILVWGSKWARSKLRTAKWRSAHVQVVLISRQLLETLPEMDGRP